jgi:hypothetical protein
VCHLQIIHPLFVCHVKAGSCMTHLRPMLPSVPLTFGCVYKPLVTFEIHSFWDRSCLVTLNFESCHIDEQDYVVSVQRRKTRGDVVATTFFYLLCLNWNCIIQRAYARRRKKLLKHIHIHMYDAPTCWLTRADGKSCWNIYKYVWCSDLLANRSLNHKRLPLLD